VIDIMNISSTSGVNLKCFLLFVFLLDISPHREREKTTNWFNGHTPRERRGNDTATVSRSFCFSF